MILSLTVPIPPSANQIWRRGRGHFYRSPKYEAWLKTFGQEWMAAKPRGFKTITGQYILGIGYSGLRSNRDPDNLFKAINDALQKFHIVSNDKNGRHLFAYPIEGEPGCYLTVGEA